MKNHFYLGAMAKLIGWHDCDIKVFLGIPLDESCDSDNFEEVLSMYLSSLEGESRVAVNKKLDELLLIELGKLSSKEDLRALRKKCPSHSSVRDDIIIKEISLCSSLQEINAFKYLSSMGCGASLRMRYLERKLELSESIEDLKFLSKECPFKSDIYYSVIYKWNVASRRVIKQTSEPQKMEEIFANLCPESYPFCLNCWLGICEKSEEFQKMYRFLFESNNSTIICHEAFIANLHSKWDYASFAEVLEAGSLSEALAVLAHSQDDSKHQVEVFERCLDFVETADDAEELFLYTPKRKDLLEKSFSRWLEVSDNQGCLHLLEFFKEDPGESEEIFIFLSRRVVISSILKKIAVFYGYRES